MKPTIAPTGAVFCITLAHEIDRIPKHDAALLRFVTKNQIPNTWRRQENNEFCPTIRSILMVVLKLYLRKE
jgi:hypothetical protein